MKKLTNKKVNLFGKKVPVFAIVLMSFALVSAALVPYLSGMVTANVGVSSPIEMVGVDFDYDIDHAGEDGFALLKITNNADVDITGIPKIVFNESGAAMEDMAGMNVALSEDISYCYSSEESDNMTGIDDCSEDYMTWMENNVGWNDWVANADYSDERYPSDLVVNTIDDPEGSFFNIGYTENELSLGEETIPAGGTFYAVVYVSTNPALRPGNYDISAVIEAS